MKKIILLLIGVMALQTANAQKYITRSGYIKFFSTTPVEDIEAASNQASSVLDTEAKQIVFQVLMNSFQFEKALMQEHFNENYVESEKYPKGTFSGSFTTDADISQDGEHSIQVKGKLNVHGVDRSIDETMTLTKKGDEYFLQGVFNVSPAMFKIDIPSAVRDKIGSEIEVTVKAKYQAK
jgi:polyisoprenoid-binding protein YceI